MIQPKLLALFVLGGSLLGGCESTLSCERQVRYAPRSSDEEGVVVVRDCSEQQFDTKVRDPDYDRSGN